jgi:hypothetical protein
MTMTRYVSAVPAYGRDYKSKAAVMADWNAGKDFLTQDMMLSGYVNKDDKPDGVTLNIRYKNLTQVAVIR